MSPLAATLDLPVDLHNEEAPPTVKPAHRLDPRAQMQERIAELLDKYPGSQLLGSSARGGVIMEEEGHATAVNLSGKGLSETFYTHTILKAYWNAKHGTVL